MFSVLIFKHIFSNLPLDYMTLLNVLFAFRMKIILIRKRIVGTDVVSEVTFAHERVIT